MVAGVQPEDKNAKPLARANPQSPSGARAIWLPKRFGHFSIEILVDKVSGGICRDCICLGDAAVNV
jgi:methylmalonyl-CoA/ethylmalonyl-CoA epimerase